MSRRTECLGFIGYGQMARALSAGLNESGLKPYAGQAAAARDFGRLETLAKATGFMAFADAAQLLRHCSTVILAVKPYQTASVLASLRDHFTENHLLISVVAGWTLESLAGLLPPGVDLVRAMPNTPALVRQGLTAICGVPAVRPESLAYAREIFSAVGVSLPIEENRFGAVTALSGCGPAYFLTFMEALTDGGVDLGLNRETAVKLAVQTALGAAALARDTGEPFSELRSRSVSPGGLTSAGQYVLERGALRGLVMEAMRASVEREKDLAAGAAEQEKKCG